MDGICWKLLIAVLIKMCFLRKSTSRNLETKKFEILESFVLALSSFSYYITLELLFIQSEISIISTIKVKNHSFS